jgi:hypothetical protein
METGVEDVKKLKIVIGEFSLDFVHSRINEWKGILETGAHMSV